MHGEEREVLRARPQCLLGLLPRRDVDHREQDAGEALLVAGHDRGVQRDDSPVATQRPQRGLALQRGHLAGHHRAQDLGSRAADADGLGEDAHGVERLIFSCLQQLDERRVPVRGADLVEAARQRIGIARRRLHVAAGGHQIVEMGLQRRGVALHERDGCRLEEHAIAMLALAQRILGPLALRGVDPGRHDLAQGAVLIEDRTVAPRHPHALAVPPHVLVLVREVALGVAEDVLHHVGEVAPAGLRARHDGPDDGAPGELAQGVPEEILAVLVEIDDAALGIQRSTMLLMFHTSSRCSATVADRFRTASRRTAASARRRSSSARGSACGVSDDMASGQGRYTPACLRGAMAVLSGAEPISTLRGSEPLPRR